MRIAISGTHFAGKTTLMEDMIEKLPDYTSVDEPYHLMVEEGYQFPALPDLRDFEKQLERSIQLFRESRANVIFDRCPIDFIAYALSLTDSTCFDLERWLPEVEDAMDTLDLIFFLPVEYRIPVPSSQDPDLRFDVDEKLRDILIGNSLGLEIKVVEIRGDRQKRCEQALRYIK